MFELLGKVLFLMMEKNELALLQLFRDLDQKLVVPWVVLERSSRAEQKWQPGVDAEVVEIVVSSRVEADSSSQGGKAMSFSDNIVVVGSKSSADR
jgi:hypothetical protein